MKALRSLRASTAALLASAAAACSSAGDADDAGGAVGGFGGAGAAAGGRGGAASGGSASGGRAGGGAAGADGGAAGELEPCPEAEGSPMVRLPEIAGGFCVDAHEATAGEYRKFLDEVESLAPQPAYCAWNETFEPNQDNSDEELPVVGVDFCDARAYCSWAGKRLCGAIGGGALDFDAYADARESQWYAACSRGGTRIFPYGNSYDGQLCNGADAGREGPADFRQSECEGGYDGIFDMSGNVWEWEDACDGTSGVGDHCRLRGGEFTNPEGFLRCDYGEFSITRDFATSSIGIRCCGP